MSAEAALCSAWVLPAVARVLDGVGRLGWRACLLQGGQDVTKRKEEWLLW